MAALAKFGAVLLLASLALASSVARANLWVVSITAEAYLQGIAGDSEWTTAYFYFDPETVLFNPNTGDIEGPDVFTTHGIRTQMGATILHNVSILIPPNFVDPHAMSVESWSGSSLGTIRGNADGRWWTCIGDFDCFLYGRVTFSRVPEPGTPALLVLALVLGGLALGSRHRALRRARPRT